MVMAMITPNTAKVIHLNSSATAPAAKAEPLPSRAAANKASLLKVLIMSGSHLVRFVDDFLRHGVEFGIGPLRVDEGNGPGHDEFGQGKQDADVDHAPYLDLEQVLVIGRADRQQKIINRRK